MPRSTLRLALLGLALAGCSGDPLAGPAQSPVLSRHAPAAPSQPVTVFATGFQFPRGLAFGPDGALYVAEAGSAGPDATDGSQCAQVGAPIGPYHNGPTGRISVVDRRGVRTTLATGFPSGINGFGDILGVADVAISDGELYALVAGGGCSHGTTAFPAGIARVRRNGSWSMVADLSAWQATHPVAQPFAPDFEPDGSWYAMLADRGELLAVEPNHGELVSVNPRRGTVARLLDVSAALGHIVPTVLARRGGSLYFSHLGQFPAVAGSQNVYRLARNGELSVAATGFTMVLGLEFDRAGRMYVLESSSVSGFPMPGTGRVIRVDRAGNRSVIADALFLPTALRFDPEGRWLYISNKGFGPPQAGEVLRVRVPDAAEGDEASGDA